jgi:hypothetical protein
MGMDIRKHDGLIESDARRAKQWIYLSVFIVVIDFFISRDDQ